VRFHCKNVYAKLGVHSKQELIDLVDCERQEGR
jgi:DNA-binding CsgD family transcriptional regulator